MLNVTRKAAVIVSFALLAIVPAAADTVPAQLVDSSLAGAPGDTLDFFATLTNPSATDTIFLNGIGSTASSPFLGIDTSPFDINAPFYLDPGQSSGPFELFDVTIDPAASPGPYVGSFVSILGGADGGQFTAFDDLVDISFDVQVSGGGSISPVPEPRGFLLTLAGLLAIFCATLPKKVSR